MLISRTGREISLKKREGSMEKHKHVQWMRCRSFTYRSRNNQLLPFRTHKRGTRNQIL